MARKNSKPRARCRGRFGLGRGTFIGGDDRFQHGEPTRCFWHTPPKLDGVDRCDYESTAARRFLASDGQCWPHGTAACHSVFRQSISSQIQSGNDLAGQRSGNLADWAPSDSHRCQLNYLRIGFLSHRCFFVDEELAGSFLLIACIFSIWILVLRDFQRACRGIMGRTSKWCIGRCMGGLGDAWSLTFLTRSFAV